MWHSNSARVSVRTVRRGLGLAAALSWSILTAPATAAAVPPLVAAMLDNAPAAAESRCSYTRTRVDDDETRRERFRAGDVEAPWALEQVNGRAPTGAEQRRYARGADDRDRRHPLAFDLRSMIDPDHWRLRSETPAEAVYEFRLRPGDDLEPKLAAKVLGTLVVDRVRRQPIRITLENTEPAYVAPLVRIAQYTQDMQFRWDESIGASVLTRTETDWHGRAFGLKTLAKHKLVLYSNYQCSPEVAGPAR